MSRPTAPHPGRVVEDRLHAVERTGARLFVERLRFQWHPGTPIPSRGAPGFRPARHTEEILALMTQVLDETLDAHNRHDLTRMSDREAAIRHHEDELAHFRSPAELVADRDAAGRRAGGVRYLIFASVVTLALNVADPLVAGEYGKAAFDAVGPLLLIGWADVGPGFLQAIGAANPPETTAVPDIEQQGARTEELVADDPGRPNNRAHHTRLIAARPAGVSRRPTAVLLEQARQEDAAHRAAHQKPISADALRVRLGIGATPARRLVKIVRAEFQTKSAPDQADEMPTDEAQIADAALAA